MSWLTIARPCCFRPDQNGSSLRRSSSASAGGVNATREDRGNEQDHSDQCEYRSHHTLASHLSRNPFFPRKSEQGLPWRDAAKRSFQPLNGSETLPDVPLSEASKVHRDRETSRDQNQARQSHDQTHPDLVHAKGAPSGEMLRGQDKGTITSCASTRGRPSTGHAEVSSDERLLSALSGRARPLGVAARWRPGWAYDAQHLIPARHVRTPWGADATRADGYAANGPGACWVSHCCS